MISEGGSGVNPGARRSWWRLARLGSRTGREEGLLVGSGDDVDVALRGLDADAEEVAQSSCVLPTPHSPFFVP